MAKIEEEKQQWLKIQVFLWFPRLLEVYCVANVVFPWHQMLLICVSSVCAMKLTLLKWVQLYLYSSFLQSNWVYPSKDLGQSAMDRSKDPERIRYARDTSLGMRHLNFWSKSQVFLWIVCFFRSVTKVDYLTFRHGFIAAHLTPRSDATLEDDFLVVEIRSEELGKREKQWKSLGVQSFHISQILAVDMDDHLT